MDPLGSGAPQLVVQSDAAGLSFGAARITGYHFQGSAAKPVALSPTHLKAGVLIVAYHCASATAWNSLLSDALGGQITMSSRKESGRSRPG